MVAFFSIPVSEFFFQTGRIDSKQLCHNEAEEESNVRRSCLSLKLVCTSVEPKLVLLAVE